MKYGKEKAEKIMHKISPVAWQHINFVGRYKFLSKGDDINFESLADVLIEELESFLNR